MQAVGLWSSSFVMPSREEDETKEFRALCIAESCRLEMRSWNIVTILSLRWRDFVDVTVACGHSSGRAFPIRVSLSSLWGISLSDVCALRLDETIANEQNVNNHNEYHTMCDRLAASPMRPKRSLSIWLSWSIEVSVSHSSITATRWALVVCMSIRIWRFDKFTKQHSGEWPNKAINATISKRYHREFSWVNCQSTCRSFKLELPIEVFHSGQIERDFLAGHFKVTNFQVSRIVSEGIGHALATTISRH